MRKLLIACFTLILPLSVLSQKLNVQEGSEVVETISRNGMFIVIRWDDKKIEKAWEKKLKEFGKVQNSKGAYNIISGQIPGVTSNPGQIYSKVVKDGEGAKVWFAIDLGSSFVNSSNKSAYAGASQILTDFAAACYRDAINEEIEAAEKELEKAVKNHEKEVTEGENLVKDVEKNRQEKLELERKLLENANELKQIQTDIEKNKTDQKNAQLEIEKEKKELEAIKKKLDQIGR
jgi:hypothetical protein